MPSLFERSVLQTGHNCTKATPPILVILLALAASIFFGYGSAFAFSDMDDSELTKITIAQCQGRISHHFSKQIIVRAYHHIGIKVAFTEMPCRRSIELANRGIYDGEVGKIPGTSSSFSNLIAVESPIFMIEGVAFTKSVSRKITSWDDLKGLKIGIVSGQLFAEQGTKGMKPVIASHFSQLVSLLVIDRIDIGIGLLQDYQLMKATETSTNQEIHMVGQPLFTAPLFHLIHKKHKSLVPRLTETLKTMWENGETTEIHQQTLEKLKQNPDAD